MDDESRPEIHERSFAVFTSYGGFFLAVFS